MFFDGGAVSSEGLLHISSAFFPVSGSHVHLCKFLFGLQHGWDALNMMDSIVGSKSKSLSARCLCGTFILIFNMLSADGRRVRASLSINHCVCRFAKYGRISFLVDLLQFCVMMLRGTGGNGSNPRRIRKQFSERYGRMCESDLAGR